MIANCVALNYNINCFLLEKKKKKIVCFNCNFFFFFFICKNIKINVSLNLINVQKSNQMSTIQLNVKKILNIFCKKIIFNGRGFKIEKKKKMQFNFVSAFKTYVILKSGIFLKTKKNKITIILKSNKFIDLKKIFFFNKFTKKGLRYSSFCIKKKK